MRLGFLLSLFLLVGCYKSNTGDPSADSGQTDAPHFDAPRLDSSFPTDGGPFDATPFDAARPDAPTTDGSVGPFDSAPPPVDGGEPDGFPVLDVGPDAGPRCDFAPTYELTPLPGDPICQSFSGACHLSSLPETDSLQIICDPPIDGFFCEYNDPAHFCACEGDVEVFGIPARARLNLTMGLFQLSGGGRTCLFNIDPIGI